MSEALARIPLQSISWNGHGVNVAQVEGRPFWKGLDMCAPLDCSKQAIHKMIASLPESEKCQLQVDTPSSGLQWAAFVSREGALEIAIRSRSPQRMDFIRRVVDMATTPTAPALAPSDTLAALPARVDQLAAENQTLAARVAKLEKRKQPREMKLLSAPPQHEVDALLRAWHEQHGTEWVKLAAVLPLMAKVPTLLRAGRTEAARVLRFGHLLTGLDRVERHRSSDSRWVRLVAA